MDNVGTYNSLPSLNKFDLLPYCPKKDLIIALPKLVIR